MYIDDDSDRDDNGQPAPPPRVPTAEDAARAVRRVADSAFPGAWAIVVGGSLMRGAGTPTSDADVLVLTDDARAPYRHSLVFCGQRVEAFVHTVVSYQAYAASDCASGTPILPTICAEGRVLWDHRGTLPVLREEARRAIAAGPPALSGEQIDDYRYFLTDLVEDLEGFQAVPGAADGERRWVAHALAVKLADFQLRRAGRWSGTGKWLYRQLHAADPAGAARLLAASAAASAGQVGPLVALADEVLAASGGRLFHGYWRAGPMPPP